jgi:two-component system, OmpR family, sensor histidine kinase KdpD
MRDYLRTALVLVVCTVLGTIVREWLSITDVAMLYLLGVGLVATWSTRRQALVAAVLSVGLFDFFFVPPRFTFTVEDVHYVFTFGVMLVTALVISRLAERVRSEARAAETRERGTAALYPMRGDLLEAQTLEEVLSVIRHHVQTAFDADARVLLREATHLVTVGASGSESESGLRIAESAYQSWQSVGRGTKNFPDSDALYLPLVGTHGRLGVLAVRPDDRARFDDPAVLWLLQTFAAQAALAIERVRAVR